MEQFVALRDKYGGIGDMVGGRTKVRSVPIQHRVEALARALLKTKVESSKRRRMHACCRSRRNGDAALKYVTSQPLWWLQLFCLPFHLICAGDKESVIVVTPLPL